MTVSYKAKNVLITIHKILFLVLIVTFQLTDVLQQWHRSIRTKYKQTQVFVTLFFNILVLSE